VAGVDAVFLAAACPARPGDRVLDLGCGVGAATLCLAARVPGLVHAGVVTVAVITGLQQLGIDISFITQLALVLLASLVGGLSIAFALGARRYVANLMAQPELARYGTGERLRIDADEGVVVEIHRTGLILATDEGLVSIPAARLAEGRVVRITSEPVEG